MKRYCQPFFFKDLTKKMVFIGGSRQKGKATLSQSLCYGQFSEATYLSWDNDEDKKAMAIE